METSNNTRVSWLDVGITALIFFPTIVKRTASSSSYCRLQDLNLILKPVVFSEP